MFRKVYIQILGILILSTSLLMFISGLVIYREFQTQSVNYGRSALSEQMCEVIKTAPTNTLDNNCTSVSTFSDTRGEDIYFNVFRPDGRIISQTASQPVPIRVILATAKPNGFTSLVYNGKPYRVLNSKVQKGNTTYNAYAYSLIVQERNALARVQVLMFTVGGVGLALCIAMNVFVAARALRPAQRTWRAYQDSTIELSHELQTPLATMRAILDTRALNAEMKADLELEVNRASEMVQNILYLSRLQITEPNQSVLPVCVTDVTEDVTERFKALASQRSIQLTGVAGPGLYVKTTIESWERLISTLMKNVVDHSTKGSTATWSLQSTNNIVRFIIENDTSTLPNRNKTFVPGIGLRIVQRLVSEMRGVLRVEYKGARVKTTVEIPKLSYKK